MKIARVLVGIVIMLAVVGCGTLKKGSTSGEPGTNVADTTVVSDNSIAITNPAKQLSGEWTIVTVKGDKVNTTERPFVTLDFSDNRLYGNNGCNVINGIFECNGSNIRFDNIISTMMSCDNATSEREIMKIFNDVVAVKLYEKNDIKRMHLVDKKGHTIAIMKEQNLNFMNGAWTVDKINEQPTIDENVRLVIDIDQLTLHGNSGCNILNGTIYVDYGKDWGVQFQQLLSTMKMCENIKTETALLVALEMTETCRPVSDTKIALYDNKGNCVAVLKKLQIDKR